MTWPFLDLLSQPQRDLLPASVLSFLLGVLLTSVVLGRVHRRRLARLVQHTGENQAEPGAGTLSLVNTDEATADALEVIVMAGRGSGTGYADDPSASTRFGGATYRARAGNPEAGTRGPGWAMGPPEPAMRLDVATSDEGTLNAGAGRAPDGHVEPGDAPQPTVLPEQQRERGATDGDEVTARAADARDAEPTNPDQPTRADVTAADEPEVDDTTADNAVTEMAPQPASGEPAAETVSVEPAAEAVSVEPAAPEMVVLEPASPEDGTPDAASPEGASPEEAAPEEASPEEASPEEASLEKAPHGGSAEAVPVAEGPYGPGSIPPLSDGSSPSADHTVKGNLNSKLYHTTASPYYQRTKADAYFRSTEDAERGGFTAWNRRRRRG